MRAAQIVAVAFGADVARRGLGVRARAAFFAEVFVLVLAALGAAQATGHGVVVALEAVLAIAVVEVARHGAHAAIAEAGLAVALVFAERADAVAVVGAADAHALSFGRALREILAAAFAVGAVEVAAREIAGPPRRAGAAAAGQATFAFAFSFAGRAEIFDAHVVGGIALLAAGAVAVDVVR